MSAAKEKAARDEPVDEAASERPQDARSLDEHVMEEQALAGARADDIMDRAGERVGQFIRSGERAGQFLRSGGEQVKHFRAREKEADAPQSEEFLGEEPPASVARAEVIMDRAGERLGQLLRFGGQQVYRTTALAREAVEDFVAEAESIRRRERSSPD